MHIVPAAVMGLRKSRIDLTVKQSVLFKAPNSLIPADAMLVRAAPRRALALRRGQSRVRVKVR